MVTFLPSRPGRLADVPSFTRAIGGAESNVACVLAAAGHRAKWVGRVGRDGFGDHLVDVIGGHGVDVTAVGRDPHRPTGIYFRTDEDRATDAHEVVYYRAGSAASAMSPATVPYESVDGARILHLTGITAALSGDCLALVRELTAPRPGRPLVSFDVNHRPALWRAGDAPGVLLGLARRADVVFVGADEAERLWGLADPRAVFDALPEPGTVVVKLGGTGAVAVDRGAHEDEGDGVFVPAPRVDVVSPIGAGDAFAAGFLSATLRGLGLGARLRHGHLAAAAALTVPGDLAAPPRRDRADRLAALGDEDWGTLHLGPGWTEADEKDPGRTGDDPRGPGRTGDDQEVRTP
ncbi:MULTISPECIES: sugar kinase [unclassified Streptomyces]|uniref:sugar kinase n=1 Tax=unclassified Streptomyces TaxID=2593676 RepID=UPI0006C188D4|nr:carbohydrate kinase [Streptomyces sp. NRRL F-6491]KOX37901.1 carbohydrate kinase [Streptomyces sp. NRRL F-6492]